MEQSQRVKIKYTANYFASAPDDLLSVAPVLRYSQNEEPIHFQTPSPGEDDAPILEIITDLNAADFRGADVLEKASSSLLKNVAIRDIRGSLMIVHSEILSRIIKDVVGHYPGQNLTGNTLVIREPYAPLMHNMSGFEALMTRLGGEPDVPEKAGDSLQREHLQVLLEFLRPKFLELYVPATKRLSQKSPTVAFKDMWVLMKSGSVAYTKVDGYWIGCVIGEVEKLPPHPLNNLHQRWAINTWFLQTHWPSDELGCVTRTIIINGFDGQKPVTDLPIFPCEFHDRDDEGARKRGFEERGEKVWEILQGESKYMCHDGECMDLPKRHHEGRIVVDGTQREGRRVFRWSDDGKELDPEQHWKFDLVPPGEVITRELSPALSKLDRFINPKKDSHDLLTKDLLFVMSPCLSAFALSNNTWMLINVENIRPLELPDHNPPPFIAEENLRMLNALADSYNADDTPPADSGKKYDGKGAIILLHGHPGAGKTFTVEYTSTRIRRPLLALSPKDFENRMNAEQMEVDFTWWFSLCERWNAVLYLDQCEIFLEGRFDLGAGKSTSREAMYVTNSADQHSYGVLGVFMASSSWSPIELDLERRRLIWRSLEKRYEYHGTRRIVLTPRATKFLESSEMNRIEWNGHEINHCFHTAVALAKVEAEADEITVDADHFKDAVNMAYDFRQYIGEIRGFNDVDIPTRRRPVSYYPPPPVRTYERERVRSPSPPPRIIPYAPPIREYVVERGEREEFSPGTLSEADSDDYGVGRVGRSRSRARNVGFIDASLCIPHENRVEWDKFQTAGRGELFRKTKFHAIDVLVGEPQIRLEPSKNSRRRRKAIPATSNPQSIPINVRGQPERATTFLPGEGPLPERIRINSPAIIEALTSINDDLPETFEGPFLMFQPFRSLLYYEQELRDWTNRLEAEAQEPSNNDTSDEDADEESEERRKKAAVEEMRCLISFIDNEIKKKQEYLTGPRCRTVRFSDLWFLFNPGDAVISPDDEQVYRVIKVTSTTHRVKSNDEESFNFWKDETYAEFEDNPVFLHCVHIDFNGKYLGPVSRIFAISRFYGLKDIIYLPVFPLRFYQDGFREKLIQRGKTFFAAAGIKHMHYNGLTVKTKDELKTRDEVDSQVVIDFEEALARNPEWAPAIKSALEDDVKKTVSFEDTPPTAMDTDLRKYHKAQRNEKLPCVRECCKNQTIYSDEYVDSRRREDYILSQISETRPRMPSVAIIQRPLDEIDEDTSITDEDYLIMCYRVFGFVLRTRKWHKLDLANISEVAALGEGEGFDQLVLPPGHKEMVKSMIRQHFRDKKLASVNRDRTDVVRGKGKGLIMLLHGVPGVGKTSTAECVADSFRRPLFQITSGDLGTTARDVEEALEENFSLASRWNSILLIDEADVFLAERTKEDFVRNSLVAVFLRIMEYYSGVLFLTTNRVGVFDEAFTSRIHISLYYPPLERSPTLQIFQKNWERIQARYDKDKRSIDIKVSEITEFALDYFDKNEQGRWNGRQIRNAFQSALALAELDALGTDDIFDDAVDQNRLVTLRKSHFEVVAAAYKGFIDYLKQVYGADFARRARENLWRYDTFGITKMPNALTTRLRVAEPAPPPEAWPPQSHGGYNTNRDNYPPYPPPQSYPDRYDYQNQRARYSQSPGNVPYRDPREAPPNPAPYDPRPAPAHPEGYGRGMPYDRQPGGPPGWDASRDQAPPRSKPMPPQHSHSHSYEGQLGPDNRLSPFRGAER